MLYCSLSFDKCTQSYDHDRNQSRQSVFPSLQKPPSCYPFANKLILERTILGALWIVDYGKHLRYRKTSWDAYAVIKVSSDGGLPGASGDWSFLKVEVW